MYVPLKKEAEETFIMPQKEITVKYIRKDSVMCK